MPTPRIETEHVTIRPWEAGDVAALARLADDEEVSRNLRDRFPWPYGRHDAEEFVAAARCGLAGLAWAIEAEGALVGGIGLEVGADVERFSAEVGYWLGRSHWGRGIATAAVRAVVAHGFDTLGLARLWALTFQGNGASARVLQKAGFAHEGVMRAAILKRGRLLDADLWGRVNREFQPDAR